MNPFTILSLSALLAVSAAAQQTLTFGVKPGQTTSGSGSLGVVVGGFGTVPISVPPGTGSQGVANAMAAALQGAGFTVQQNGTDVTVTSGPGGAPLKNGGGIGSTDSGITGVKAKVHKAPPPNPGPNPGPNPNPPGNKVNGGKVPKAQGAGQANGPGSIQVDVEIWKWLNGAWTLQWIQVVVPVLPGDDADAINQRVKQQVENAGVKVNDITLPQSIAPITPIPCMGLDRTFNGETVQSVQFDASGSALIFFPELFVGAGEIPLFGPTDIDVGLRADGSENPYFIEFNGTTSLPGGGFIDAFVDPNTINVFMIGFRNSQLPWQGQIFPIPQIGLFHSMVDPFFAQTQLLLPDPLGHAQMPLQLPNAPALGGLQLMVQAVTLDPQAANVLGSVQRTSGLAIGIGQ